MKAVPQAVPVAVPMAAPSWGRLCRSRAKWPGRLSLTSFAFPAPAPGPSRQRLSPLTPLFVARSYFWKKTALPYRGRGPA